MRPIGGEGKGGILKYIPCARHCSTWSSYINSFNPQNNPVRRANSWTSLRAQARCQLIQEHLPESPGWVRCSCAGFCGPLHQHIDYTVMIHCLLSHLQSFQTMSSKRAKPHFSLLWPLSLAHGQIQGRQARNHLWNIGLCSRAV